MYEFIAFTPDSRCLVRQCGELGAAEDVNVAFEADHNAFTVANGGCNMFR
jgi:hypothetical protein